MAGFSVKSVVGNVLKRLHFLQNILWITDIGREDLAVFIEQYGGRKKLDIGNLGQHVSLAFLPFETWEVELALA